MKRLAIAAFIILGCALYMSLDWGIYRCYGGNLALTEYWAGHRWGLAR